MWYCSYVPYADPERKRAYEAEYKRAHRAQYAAGAREHRRRVREGYVRPTEVICETCGTEIVVGLNGPVPRYCSRSCSPGQRLRVRLPKPRKPKQAFRCQRCERGFLSHASYAKWCSKRCAKPRAEPGWRTRVRRSCVECGAEFIGGAASKRCLDCAATRRAAKQRHYKGAYLRSPKGRAYRRRRDRRQYQTPAGKARCRARKRRHEYRRRGAAKSTPYSRAEIAERDGWKCHLCGGRVSKTAKWPDQMCASMDHLIPLADGGADGAENVRLAHWICNTRRGRGGEVQLLLIA
jgi:HNH endonuclease